MSNKNTNETRTFTEAEMHVLTSCLIACRHNVSDEDRDIIDGIIRDGWKASK
jgi:hypothetical protein